MEAWFASRPSVTSFPDMVAWHLRHGYLFNTRDYFVMGRPIQLQNTREETDIVIDSLFVYEAKNSNCWYFSALSGNLRGVWHLLPYELPWMAYHRMIRGQPRLFVRPLSAFRTRSFYLDFTRN